MVSNAVAGSFVGVWHQLTGSTKPAWPIKLIFASRPSGMSPAAWQFLAIVRLRLGFNMIWLPI